MLMLAATLLLIAAASGGWVMARKIWRGSMPPAHLALGHGILVAPALVLAAYAVSKPGTPRAGSIGIALLMGAALGGFVLVAFHARRKLPPRNLVIAHAAAAAAGILALLVAAIFPA